MAQSTTSFVNHNWTENGTIEETNLFSSISMEVTIYTSDQYDIYEAFLASSEASNKVDEDVDYLT